MGYAVSENSDYEEPISSKRLREALGEASIVLGLAAQDAMFRDLELNGITFKNAQYSLNEVQNALRRIFGHDGTDLLMQRLRKVLD